MDDGDDDDTDDDDTDDDTDDDHDDDDTDDDNDHKNDSYTAAGAAPGASIISIYLYGRIRFTSDTRMSKTICPSLVLIYFAHLFLKSIGGTQKSIPQIHTPK